MGAGTAGKMAQATFRRKTPIGLLAAGMVAAGLITPASASASATTFSMILTQTDGLSPVGNAAYEIVYMQPANSDLAVGANVLLNVLASGNADFNGIFTATLNTAVIDPADLGDTDGGGASVDAFNADVIVQDDRGVQVPLPEIMQIGQADADSASVALMPSSSPAAAWNAGAFPSSVPILDTKYRFTPVTPLNVGDGMEAVLHNTYTTSNSKQTKVDTAIQASGWRRLGELHHATGREKPLCPRALTHDNDYHRWIWASYKYNEYAYARNNKWQANHWTGDMEENNTDAGGKHGTNNPIGIVKWDVPSFTPGPGGAYWFALTSANSGWGRDSGNRAANDAGLSFYFPFAGDITVTT